MKKKNTLSYLRISSLLILFSLFSISLFGQGVTTGKLSGKLTNQAGNPLDGATVVAVHMPSGTTYSTLTDPDGTYIISNMRVGSPYRIVFSILGHSTQQLENVEIVLGENKRLNGTLNETSTELETIEIIARSGNVGETSGAGTQISNSNINNMPTLNRDIRDFTRLTPQSTSIGEGSSFAGTNNRFNAIYIDGAVNNDVFGLAASGTNGGQTGISPFSIDIIDQVQVVLSPYDVSLGGFAGAGISAVTKSGTNKIEGTAYYFLQNQNLVGKSNKTYLERYGLKDTINIADFSKTTYGASLGGPIKKDKVFYFANVELQKDETPVLYDIQTYTGNSNEAQLNTLKDKLIKDYNYDPGTFGNTSDELEGLKLFGKIDWNINQNHRLTARHNYTKAQQFDRNFSSSRVVNFSNNGIYFPSLTNSSAIELNSRFGTLFSNNLIIGYTDVNDNRDALGTAFPFVRITDGPGQIIFGTEEFSTANILTQKIFTLTDNFKIYRKKHTVTVGTHNEFYNIRNVFIGQNYGSYTYDSLAGFLNNLNASRYNRSYSLVDSLDGDNTDAAAEFKAMQLGVYVQDEVELNSKLSFNLGIRLDVPFINSNPKKDTLLANQGIQKLAGYYSGAENVEVGKAPEAQLMFSPRLGFNYKITNDGKFLLRGGIGIFTSRIPFVWPGAMFNNNGLTIGSVSQRDIQGGVRFIPNINEQYINPNFRIPSGNVDLFTKDFKYPQVQRANLAFDVKLPYGVFFSLEGIVTKTLNNIIYTNINSDTAAAANGHWSGSGDTRPVYANKSILSNYSAIYLASNTSRGSTYSITGTVSKNFNFGLQASVAYTYGDSYSLNDGTSSQNSSQWRNQLNVNGRNFPEYGRSDYAIGHRLISNLSYTKNWGNKSLYNTTISLFYDMRNNQTYSYVIGGATASQNPNAETGSTGRNRSLVYVPKDQNDISLVDYTSGGVTVTAQQQWDKLNSFIESDPYLSKHRGEYVEKNSNLGIIAHFIDLSIRQDLGMKIGNRIHKFQFSFDVFNLANLLNRSWGERYFIPGEFNYYYLLNFEKLVADPNNANKVTKPTYTYRGGSESGKASMDISNFSSRWQGRIGIRYIF